MVNVASRTFAAAGLLGGEDRATFEPVEDFHEPGSIAILFSDLGHQRVPLLGLFERFHDRAHGFQVGRGRLARRHVGVRKVRIQPLAIDL